MQTFWFVLIGVLWAGFFLLEGFDFGVGMLAPFVGRSEPDRQVALRSIGPVWDGNEVWLIVAGAAMFAAFPEWYSSVFSGFYLAFAFLLVGLIVRGIGIEYRGKAISRTGRRWCDIGIFIGSLLPALLLGVAFADFVRGVDMNSGHDVTGGFFALLSPFALLGGVVSLALFTLHGATFLALRTDGRVRSAAKRASSLIAPLAVVAALPFVVWTFEIRGDRVSLSLGIVLVLAIGLAARSTADWKAFASTSLAVMLIPVWTFSSLWPDVLPARNNSAFSLTVHNASSTHYTLVVMAVVAVIFTPVVLAYQAWSYWVFRARVTGEPPEPSPLLVQAKASLHEMLGPAR